MVAEAQLHAPGVAVRLRTIIVGAVAAVLSATAIVIALTMAIPWLGWLGVSLTVITTGSVPAIVEAIGTSNEGAVVARF